MRVVSVLLCVFTVGQAWDVDSRCPGPHNRMLDVWEDETYDEVEDDDFHDEGLEFALVGPSIESAEDGALRGSNVAPNNSTTVQRNLISSSDVFSIKMYWERGFCWQEEYDRHRRWCWECIGSSCGEGEELWFQSCNSNKQTQRFQYLVDPQGRGGRIKVASKNLCLTRVSNNAYVLKACGNQVEQIVVGMKFDGAPFEMQPLQSRTKCINQHHHPKAGEVVENTNCRTARKWHTNLFELVDTKGQTSSSTASTYPVDELSLRNPECTEKRPCQRCQGDCDNNDQCVDDLVCFQRQNANGDADVTGCSGQAVRNKDYCIEKGQLSIAATTTTATTTTTTSTTSARKNLDRSVRTCTSKNQCGECQGDCSSDNDCKGSLKCFNKGKGRADDPHVVPGCFGVDVSKTDWCYQP